MAARFFVPFSLSPDALIALPADVVAHLQVLRIRPGDAICLFDGTGGEYPARLETLDKRSATAQTGAHNARDTEAPYRLTLVQGIAGGDKMDWLIEKCVELGVAAIQPLAAERSVVRLSGEREQKRLAHWRNIVVAASEQCGRNRLAEVRPVLTVAEWISARAADTDPALLLTPQAQPSLTAAAGAAPRSLQLLIGPEGGWSERELAQFEAAGCVPARAGHWVWRTETAGLATIAALHAHWGMFS